MQRFNHFENQYTDVDELTDHIRDWGVEFRPLEKGVMASKLNVVQTPCVTFQKVFLEKKVHQVGGAPKSALTIGFFQGDDITWCSASGSHKDIMLFSENDEWDAVSQRNFTGYTLSFSKEQLEKNLPLSDSELEVLHTNGSPQLMKSSQELTRVKKLIIDGFREISICQNPIQQNNFRRFIEEELILALLHAFDKNRGNAVDCLTFSNGDRLRRAALNIIYHSHSASSTVASICRELSTSQSTLERSFKQAYGIGPKRYMDLVKLQRLNRSLKQAPRSSTITAIAAQHGYWHMGQLGKDYKALFGCTPSQTLKCKS